jgi:hypothetical protein
MKQLKSEQNNQSYERIFVCIEMKMNGEYATVNCFDVLFMDCPERCEKTQSE